MKQGWLIYNEEDLKKNKFFAEKLVQYGKEEQLELIVLTKEELVLSVQAQRLSVQVRGKAVSYPTFVINRSRDAFIGRQFELMGISVFNGSKVTEICNNKAVTHQYMSTLGIPMMDSFLFDKRYMSLGDCTLTYPIVIKTLEGHGGNEVFKAECREVAEKILQEREEHKLLIQPMCQQPGVDVRVFVMGDKIIQAMKRTSLNDFRSNYSLGGKVYPCELTNKQEEMVQKILKKLPMDFAGIDFILDEKDNFLFNEIEDVVGCRMLYAKTTIDAAKMYMTYIREVLQPPLYS